MQNNSQLFEIISIESKWFIFTYNYFNVKCLKNTLILPKTINFIHLSRIITYKVY